jgi:hypothetical protein
MFCGSANCREKLILETFVIKDKKNLESRINQREITYANFGYFDDIENFQNVDAELFKIVIENYFCSFNYILILFYEVCGQET